MQHQEDGRLLIPDLHETVFVAEGARIYGDVIIGERSSVWFNAVLRGDEGTVRIGMHVNIQDNVVIHSDLGISVVIDDRVTIGHGAVIRSCRICSGVMIGMNSTVMTGSEIGENSVVGANALIPYKRKFPPKSLIMGVPAKRVRELTDEEVGFNRAAVEIYLDLVGQYASGKIRSR